MKTWKLLFGFVLVSVLSATVAVGTYAYLNRSNGTFSSGNQEFSQVGGYRMAAYAEAAENTDFTFAAEQSVNAVVHIKSVAAPSQRNRNGRNYIDPFEYFFGEGNPFSQQRQQPRVGFGSGVIISTDGYIVTNNHVIEGADEIEVITNDDQTYKAKLIGRDEATDIALLKIDGKNLHVLPFGNSDILKVGEWVLAVGNPLNLTSTVTAGIVSATGRGELFSGYGGMGRGMPSENKIQSYIQTDAAVNPGNSGGALVNTKGELIGINAALISETGNYIGYSFAIPINIVKKVISDIKQYGMVQRALLGVKVTNLSELKAAEPEKYEKLKVHEGIYVAGFSSLSSAEKAGLKEGDVIVGINDAKIKNYSDLTAQLSHFSPGDKVKVQVNRAGDVKTYTVELKNDQGTTETIKYKSPADIIGASFKELSREDKIRLGINSGIELTDLTNGKLKSEGIKKGFIILTANDTRITTPDEFIKIVETILKKDPDERGLFLKGFYPDSRRVEYFAIDLNE
ncbi:MAG: trypsin-like peptidase domain-containing protein [Dysgonamonadaceae bacterium]|jgi:Do/DeqQ family serine protease|nr:trypsin-like peptidase domain-containing protein [Dysgonamonadaceae bacterium]